MWFVIDMVDKVSDCGAQNYGYLVLGGSLGSWLERSAYSGHKNPLHWSQPNNYSERSAIEKVGVWFIVIKDDREVLLGYAN